MRATPRLTLGILVVLCAHATFAADPRVVEEFRDWSVYAYEDDSQQHCYAATYPVSRRGQTEGWDDSWLLVTNDPLQGFRHSVSFTLGRPLQHGSTVRANVGKRTFELASEGDTAWTTDDRMDLRLVVAMKRGRRIVISATAEGGQRILDSFSLMGFTSALTAAAERCRQR